MFSQQQAWIARDLKEPSGMGIATYLSRCRGNWKREQICYRLLWPLQYSRMIFYVRIYIRTNDTRKLIKLIRKTSLVLGTSLEPLALVVKIWMLHIFFNVLEYAFRAYWSNKETISVSKISCDKERSTFLPTAILIRPELHYCVHCNNFF